MLDTPKLKCYVCEDEGDCGGTIPKCANCWEVERRLDMYLRSEKGQKFVVAALEKKGYTVCPTKPK